MVVAPLTDMADLNQPSDLPSSLFLARGDEVSDYRPFFTGDVIDGLQIPGVDEDGPAVLIDHPCSMRRGPKLRSHLLAARVVSQPAALKDGAWPVAGFFDYFPLPDLPVGTINQAISLGLIGRVRNADLGGLQRVACLSSEGITLLWQRKIFREARLVVPLPTLGDLIAPKIDEVELWECWSEDLAPSLVAGGMTLADALEKTGEDFSAFLDENGHRVALEDVHLRADVRRAVRAEIRRLT